MLLAIALIVLGPEKLPGAARAAGRMIAEFRRVTSGLQDEVRQAFEGSDLASPIQELRATADSWRGATLGAVGGAAATTPGSTSTTTLGGPAPPSRPLIPDGDLGIPPPGDPSLN